MLTVVVIAFGAKLIGAAMAVYANIMFGTRKSLGLVLIAGGCVAGVDGWICKSYMGKGEWNHWGYGSMMVMVGSVLLGVADGR